MPAQLRCFVAVEIDDEVHGQLARLTDELIRCDAKVKWVEPDNMHLTLKFLGDVDVNETAEICLAVNKATAGCAPFHFHVRGVGAFPNLARPRTVWIGADEGKEELCELQEAVDRSLAALGYPRERRRFQPHLTIGRVRQLPHGGGNLPELLKEHADFAAGISRVDEVVVFSSQLEPGGPIYTPLGRGTLRG